MRTDESSSSLTGMYRALSSTPMDQDAHVSDQQSHRQWCHGMACKYTIPGIPPQPAGSSLGIHGIKK